jgi:3'-phosphoadenosine 5'-phosphosulfate sulfotransferase (PAPS reductase)/FAD synthetase
MTGNTKMNPWMLNQRQALPLDAKLVHTENVIRLFYEAMNGDVFVTFSGGKDSTVLLHIVRSLYPEVEAVFVNTGLEYPEIIKFVRTIGNVRWLRPRMGFKKVLETYGYPVVSKKVARQIRYLKHPDDTNANSRNLYLTGKNRAGQDVPSYKLSEKWKYLVDAPFEISEQCCTVMKEEPLRKYQAHSGKSPIIGTMASDSRARRGIYLRTGCNIMTGTPMSKPLSIWMEEDIWEYIHRHNIPYSRIYDMGVKRTGCMFCAFGAHLEAPPNRFQMMAKTHPKHYDYCMNRLGMAKILDYINVDYEQRIID